MKDDRWHFFNDSFHIGLFVLLEKRGWGGGGGLISPSLFLDCLTFRLNKWESVQHGGTMLLGVVSLPPQEFLSQHEKMPPTKSITSKFRVAKR